MRNVLKAETLERKFPLLSVENGCIVSKDADLTVAFEVELPELYTVTAAEYEDIHSSWVKAVKVLPDFSVVFIPISQLPLSDKLMTRMIIISVWTVAERCIRAMTPLSVIIRL